MCEACEEEERRYNSFFYYEEEMPLYPQVDPEIVRRAQRTVQRRKSYKEEKMPEIEAVKTGGEEKDLLIFRVKRSAEGLTIEVKSAPLAKFFAAYQTSPSEGVTTTQRIPKWGNLLIRRMDKFPILDNTTFDKPGELPMIGDYIVNLSFLRAEKLAEGVEFTIKGVFSSTQTKNFYNAARVAIKELFLEYLEDTDFEYTLTGKSSL